MLVLKFGGTSMGSAEAIKQVVEIVKEKAKESSVILVVSAMSGTTDLLLNCGTKAANDDESYKEILKQIETRHLDTVKSLIPVQQQSSVLSMVKKLCNEIEDICNGIYLLNESSLRTKDKLVSYGELLSSTMINAAFNSNGTSAVWKDARELIRTNSNYSNAIVDFAITNQQIKDFVSSTSQKIIVLPGFIASDADNITTTLGRGGSDYTAAILAAAVDASALEIWTDVSGMMTADPRWVPNAKIIPSISYQEAMELSHFGAKVIYPPTIQPVLSKNIPVWVKNTFAAKDHGTVIENKSDSTNIITGISSINSLALLSLEGSGMIGIPGFSSRLFAALANAQINVILITQGSSEHSICVGVDVASAARAKEVVDKTFEYEIATDKVDPLQIEEKLSIVALVGDQMRHHTGISGRMFSALGRNGINIRAIAQGSTERNISAVVATDDVRKAVNVLHEEFFETIQKQVNLFIVGTGNVGKRLLAQLKQQQGFLEQHLRLHVNIVGLSNSRKMLINENGIDLNKWDELLQNGEVSNLDQFVQSIIKRNLRNSVFVDVTANAVIADVYASLLEKSIAVVACNKVAASSKLNNYKKLKHLSTEFNAPFLFETNVGAGLPIIGSLNDLMRSGDRVHRMEAVLSGTLNFVFNHYDGTRPFADVVKQAQDEGYTEPDPRLDLSGTDVMRKILILAREAGVQMEMEEITCNGFLPESCVKGSVADFYEAMKKEEAHFKAIFDKAHAENCKLKFVASFNDGKASVGLQHIPPQHDLYHLYGKDNVVLFYTDRYKEQPMVVKGAGAGAEVTASGVFADILRAAQK
ncbi:bifunctional aspartate kinase/homoserine dehydrogenase I [Lacibacter sediminis]|uniref:Bifunctional aspartate kinase/homoserine dehydrogenase I n=1 Tax=Lacibacter sediminis TaxID=2760713 RepID=A0A7G5XBF0_9BACT|nr:bifunctional aspartate kinase/homoserine dehydrogenase I [Lacibacter sediminis]QNA42803.1 bifunctional aspartate kinase/homoserine dehydrogenase I [Lacibacter sediminis]